MFMFMFSIKSTQKIRLEFCILVKMKFIHFSGKYKHKLGLPDVLVIALLNYVCRQHFMFPALQLSVYVLCIYIYFFEREKWVLMLWFIEQFLGFVLKILLSIEEFKPREYWVSDYNMVKIICFTGRMYILCKMMKFMLFFLCYLCFR